MKDQNISSTPYILTKSPSLLLRSQQHCIMNASYGMEEATFHRNVFGTMSPLTFETLSWSTAIAYLLLVGLIICQALRYLNYPVSTISEFAWNCLIYLAPSRVISILDKRTGNSTMDGRWGQARKREAVRYFLGPNGEGFFSKLQNTANIPGIANLFHTTPANGPSEKPPGLGNWDNSCYQNSVIQGLASLPSLSTFLNASLGNNITKSRSTREALINIITMLNDSSNTGKLFWAPEELKSMSSWQQQDAQEYFSKLLDEVEREISKIATHKHSSGGLSELASLSFKPSDSENNGKGKVENTGFVKWGFTARFPKLDHLPDELASTLTRNPLEGLLAQRVGCLQCRFVEGLSLIPFNCLTLPLGKHWMYDVQTCLDDYTALEHIRGVECTKCTMLMKKKQLEHLLLGNCDEDPSKTASIAPPLTETQQSSFKDRLLAVSEALNDDDFSDHTLLRKCNITSKTRISTTKTRQAIVARAPKSLVIHINRSMFDESSGVQCKNHADVLFPRQLDLGPWCLGSRTSSEAEKIGIENWSSDPSKSMLPPETQELGSEAEVMYDLRAIITHYGRHENGHYICYRKHAAGFQPGTVPATEHVESWWRLSDEEVSRVSEATVLAQGGVFMLFYEKTQLPIVKKPLTSTLAEPAETLLVTSVQTPAERTLEILVETPVQSSVEIPVETTAEAPSKPALEPVVETLAQATMDIPLEPVVEHLVKTLVETLETRAEIPAQISTEKNSNLSRNESRSHDTVPRRSNQLPSSTKGLTATITDQAPLPTMEDSEIELSRISSPPKAAKPTPEPQIHISKPSSNTSLSIVSTTKIPGPPTATHLPTTALLFSSSSLPLPPPQPPFINPLVNLSFEAVSDNSMSKPEVAPKTLSSPPMRTATPHGSRGSGGLVDQGMGVVGSMVEAN